MKILSRAVAVALLAATVPATIVVAQQSEQADEQVQSSDERRGPSPETLARLEDGRIAMAKTALKLTPEQEKLWGPVEEKIRARYADMRKAREEWRAKREERRAERGDRKREKLPLPERMERRSERLAARAEKMKERAARTKEFAETLKPFYASLSDEQKEVAQHVLGRIGRDGDRRHGRRWAMNDGGRERY
jgi:hypothetical protein